MFKCQSVFLIKNKRTKCQLTFVGVSGGVKALLLDLALDGDVVNECGHVTSGRRQQLWTRGQQCYGGHVCDMKNIYKNMMDNDFRYKLVIDSYYLRNYIIHSSITNFMFLELQSMIVLIHSFISALYKCRPLYIINKGIIWKYIIQNRRHYLKSDIRTE